MSSHTTLRISSICSYVPHGKFKRVHIVQWESSSKKNCLYQMQQRLPPLPRDLRAPSPGSEDISGFYRIYIPQCTDCQHAVSLEGIRLSRARQGSYCGKDIPRNICNGLSGPVAQSPEQPVLASAAHNAASKNASQHPYH